jgi:bacterial/archaeal transporter family protein
MSNFFLSSPRSGWWLPTLAALFCWGFWAFIPKITTRYLNPSSAIVYEAAGSLCLAFLTLLSLRFQPQVHPQGIGLAFITGLLGFGGAFCFLTAVSQGPVALVATISALYPVVSVVLAVVILHEPLTLKQTIGIAIALLAMVLVAT